MTPRKWLLDTGMLNLTIDASSLQKPPCDVYHQLKEQQEDGLCLLYQISPESILFVDSNLQCLFCKEKHSGEGIEQKDNTPHRPSL